MLRLINGAQATTNAWRRLKQEKAPATVAQTTQVENKREAVKDFPDG
jgi:hypothetical protein